MTGHPIVDKVSALAFVGNVTPNSWYKAITFESGKCDLLAVTILSEVIYWYRGTEIRDEATGVTTGFVKRFASDKLHVTYDKWADKFGVTKRQVKEAFDRLCDLGLITRTLSHYTMPSGMTLHNLVYVEPVYEAVYKITTLAPAPDKANVPPPTSECTTPYVQTDQGVHPNVPQGTKTYNKDLLQREEKPLSADADVAGVQDLFPTEELIIPATNECAGGAMKNLVRQLDKASKEQPLAKPRSVKKPSLTLADIHLTPEQDKWFADLRKLYPKHPNQDWVAAKEWFRDNVTELILFRVIYRHVAQLWDDLDWHTLVKERQWKSVTHITTYLNQRRWTSVEDDILEEIRRDDEARAAAKIVQVEA